MRAYVHTVIQHARGNTTRTRVHTHGNITARTRARGIT